MAEQVEPLCNLWIDGEPYAHEGRLLELEVDERCDEASSFRLLFNMSPLQSDWDLLIDERFSLLRQITIELGVRPRGAREASERAIVMQGYVTAVAPKMGERRISDSTLELSGLDASCLMHIEERNEAWSGLSDSQIASTIYSRYGFSVNISDISSARAADRGPLVQRSTDAEFLRLLARRNGFEAYVERSDAPVTVGATPGAEIVGHFHPPLLEADAQPRLDLIPKDAPSVIEISARWESNRPTAVTSSYLDERTRRVMTSKADRADVKRLGDITLADIMKDRLGKILPNKIDMVSTAQQHASVPWDGPELRALTLASFRDADWFVTAEAIVNGARYPTILRPRRPVTLSGAGKQLDGPWYVRRACHRFLRLMPDGQQSRTYEVATELVRNALGGVG